jgi:serine/threonine protein kinase
VRADLYSLGCTFYFLLTGRILFEGTTVLEKMGKHRWDEAPAMEKFRPDVPVSVMAVVRKLMAKQPAHCYQTPQELIAALPASESTARQLLSTPARPPEVLSAFILSSLKADAERKLGPVAQVVITVPAYFEPIPGKTPRRRATWHKRWSRPSERSPSETGRRCTCTTQGCGKK